MAEHPDDVLLSIVGEKSEQYQPAAVAAARLEIAKRGLEIPNAETPAEAPAAPPPNVRASSHNGFFYVKLAADQVPNVPRRCICCDGESSAAVTIGSIAGEPVALPVCGVCKRHWERLRWRSKLFAPLGAAILLVAVGLGTRPDWSHMPVAAIVVALIAFAVPVFAAALAIRFFTRPQVDATGHAPLDRQPAEMRVTPPNADYCFSRREIAMQFGALNGLTPDELRGL